MRNIMCYTQKKMEMSFWELVFKLLCNLKKYSYRQSNLQWLLSKIFWDGELSAWTPHQFKDSRLELSRFRTHTQSLMKFIHQTQ